MKFWHRHRLSRSKKHTHANFKIKPINLSRFYVCLGNFRANLGTIGDSLRHNSSQNLIFWKFWHHQWLSRPEKHTFPNFKIKPIILSRFYVFLGEIWVISCEFVDQWRHKSRQDLTFSKFWHQQRFSRPKNHTGTNFKIKPTILSRFYVFFMNFWPILVQLWTSDVTKVVKIYVFDNFGNIPGFLSQKPCSCKFLYKIKSSFSV